MFSLFSLSPIFLSDNVRVPSFSSGVQITLRVADLRIRNVQSPCSQYSNFFEAILFNDIVEVFALVVTCRRVGDDRSALFPMSSLLLFIFGFSFSSSLTVSFYPFSVSFSETRRIS